MGLLNIGRYAADTPDPAPSGRFVSHPNVVNRLADAYRRRPYSNTITARPMYAIAPTGEQNDIREERGLYHARWYVADEPCGQHCEEREAECASQKRFRVKGERDQQLPQLPRHGFCVCTGTPRPLHG